MKEFSFYVEKRIIQRVNPNMSRARDLIEESERKRRSLSQLLNKIGLSDDNSNDIIEYCYDIIISLVRAKIFSAGYKSSGEGAHEAEVSYMKTLGFSEAEAKFMDDLRYFRNGIKYYGKRFGKEYAEKVLGFMETATAKLKKGTNIM
jgi:hypothetical protein